jgi:hypothetical protein
MTELIRTIHVRADPELRELVPDIEPSEREVELSALVPSRAAFVRLLAAHGHKMSASFVRDFALEFPPTDPYLDLEPGRLYVRRWAAYQSPVILVPAELQSQSERSNS